MQQNRHLKTCSVKLKLQLLPAENDKLMDQACIILEVRLIFLFELTALLSMAKPQLNPLCLLDSIPIRRKIHNMSSQCSTHSEFKASH